MLMKEKKRHLEENNKLHQEMKALHNENSQLHDTVKQMMKIIEKFDLNDDSVLELTKFSNKVSNKTNASIKEGTEADYENMMIAYDLRDSYVDSSKYEPIIKKKGGLFGKLSHKSGRKVEFNMKNDLFIIDEDPFEERSSLLKKSSNSISNSKGTSNKTKWVELREISIE